MKFVKVLFIFQFISKKIKIPKKSILSILFILIIIITVQAQSKDINLSVTPGVEIPFGPLSAEGEDLYSFGGSVSLIGEIPFSSESVFFSTGLLDYGLISTTADTSISIISLGLGAGISYDPVSKLNFKLCLSFIVLLLIKQSEYLYAYC